jgi:carotenoid 1,2-hydratase
MTFPEVISTRPLCAVTPPIDETPGAYQWWYFDAVSADGKTSVVVIFFVGSVFSPYYYRRYARGEQPSPLDHVAVNVAVYREGKRTTWCFSEYGSDRFEWRTDGVRIGGSFFETGADGSLRVYVDERCTLTKEVVRGVLRFHPDGDGPWAPLNLAGDAHQWRARAPRASVRVQLDAPRISFGGHGYHDENWGREPPSNALRSWSWGRGSFGQRTQIFFDATTVDGQRTFSLVDSERGVSVERLPARDLRGNHRCWMLPLPKATLVGNDDAGVPRFFRLERDLEKAPFYYRALGLFPSPDGGGGAQLGMMEHVDFARFRNPVVQRMVALRVARPDRGDPGWLP